MLNTAKRQSKLSALNWFILFLLLSSAIGVRLYHINRPPLDFSPIRQYQNAHIIRGLYYENNDSIPESSRKIAKLNMERMGFVLEPRIIENASLIGYQIMGGERLWIPRVLSAMFWVVGGLFLYLIAAKFFSPGISLFSTFFFLFLPYSILASRSIQPDPLMVMMMIFSIHRVLEYDENPSGANLITAAIITAAAVLIKPYCVFMIFGAFFSLSLIRNGLKNAIFNKTTIIFGLLIILPALIYYGYNLIANVGFLGEHVQGSFLPHLLIYPPFWRGWLNMIVQVVGYIAFILAAVGLLISKPGRPRVFLSGLWIGYFIFGLSATYQIHTHNYYTMPFIPIVALSLGPVADIVIKRLTSLPSLRHKLIIFAFVFVAIILGLGLSMPKASFKNMLSGHKSELKTAAVFIGVDPEFGKFLVDDFKDDLRIAREIGDHVAHSGNTLFLTPNFGRVIAYHGEFSGLPWPTSSSLYGRRMRGVRTPDVKEDFSAGSVEILYQGNFIKYTPDYFIVTDFAEYEKQSDLREYLNNNFPVLVAKEEYLIFDLRKMSE